MLMARNGYHMKWRWIPLFAILALSAECIAEERADDSVNCSEAYESIPHGTLLDLLDPDAPGDRRAKAVQEYQRLSAIRECPEFGYTLGQLYRQGPNMPGNPLPQDIPKARELIRAMAEAGYLLAYADLAEMEMVHGEYRESMKWTQVYLSLTRDLQQPLMKDGDDIQFSRSAYNGHLLTRAEVVWKWMKPVLPRRLISEDLSAYLGQHMQIAERVREQQQEAFGRAYRLGVGSPRMKRNPDECRLRIEDRIGAATASYIVEVLPSGKVGRTVLENFVPSAVAAERLKEECLSKYEYAPLDNEQPTTVRISLMFGSSEGASIRRRGR